MMARDTVPRRCPTRSRRPRARCRTACSPRSTPPRPRAATSAGASRRRWSSCPPRASRGGGRVDLRVEDHDAPLDELRRLLALQRAYDLAGAGDELLARGPDRRGRRALPRARPSSRPDSDELLFWSGPGARPGGRPRRRRGRRPAGGRGEPELAGPARPALTGVRPGRAKRCVSRSPEGGTSAGGCRCRRSTLSAVRAPWLRRPGACGRRAPTGEAVNEHLLTSLLNVDRVGVAGRPSADDGGRGCRAGGGRPRETIAAGREAVASSA